MRLPSPPTTQRGFTLLELLIALTVLTTGLLGVFALFNTAVAANQRAHHQHVCTMLASDAMAFLHNRRYTGDVVDAMLADDATTDPTSAADPLANLPNNFDGTLVNALGSANVAEGRLIYRRTYDIEDISPAAATVTGSRVLIRVRVTYSDAVTGAQHGVTLASARSIDLHNR